MYQFGQEEITELLPLRILHPNTDIRQDHSGTSSGHDSVCDNYTVAHVVVMIHNSTDDRAIDILSP